MSNNWQVGMATHRGMKKKSNEDSHFSHFYKDQSGNEIALFVVADGMGGYDAGDIASQIAIDMVRVWWKRRTRKSLNRIDVMDRILRELEIVIYDINDLIIETSRDRLIKMGTTISILILFQGEYGVVHIGDSRIYQMQEWAYGFQQYFQQHEQEPYFNERVDEQVTETLESQSKLHRITEDHSWVEKQIKAGILPRKLARKHPKRNVLTQCLGIKDKIYPYIQKGNYQTGDLFLLCTDGFYSLYSHEEIKSMIINVEKEYINLQTVCNYLINFSNFSKADDNITLFLIRNFFC